VGLVVVGLGNPAPEYRATRHNVGHRVVNLLAERFHRAWRRDGPTLIARGQWRGEPVTLMKLQAFMNVSGSVVATALRRQGADAADLILVYDDIDLPLGTVRVRLKGSHGGHNGVRSVLEALGTEEVRRVKVGVGRPDSKEEVPDHVLTPFLADELPILENAVELAADRTLELISRPRTS
jgi:PTH1 family peptidyl-tRNA hydrolase